MVRVVVIGATGHVGTYRDRQGGGDVARAFERTHHSTRAQPVSSLLRS